MDDPDIQQPDYGRLASMFQKDANSLFPKSPTLGISNDSPTGRLIFHSPVDGMPTDSYNPRAPLTILAEGTQMGPGHTTNYYSPGFVKAVQHTFGGNVAVYDWSSENDDLDRKLAGEDLASKIYGTHEFAGRTLPSPAVNVSVPQFGDPVESPYQHFELITPNSWQKIDSVYSKHL